MFMCIFIFCSISPILVAGNPPKIRTQLPTNSVAMTDDALATYINPAGLGTNRALNLYYLRTYQSNFPGDDALFISAPGTGFSMEFANAANDVDFARYSASAGQHFGSGFYFGTNYSWINSDDIDYDKYKSLSIGLMYRRRFFSIGAIGRDLNRPKFQNQKLGRTYDMGIALRPGTWRTTFSFDMRKTQDVRELDLSYGVEIRPVREIIFRGTYNSDKSYDIRFGVNLGNFGIGNSNFFDEGRNVNTGVGYFHFSSVLMTKPILRKRVFLDLGMERLDATLRIAKWDNNVAGVLIRINESKYGMGQFQEIRDSIMEFKRTGKVAICHITNCSTGGYIVASACDAILMHPSADIRLIGLRTERTFYKDALDKIGIQAHIENIGEYKSASEGFTRNAMSEPHRENLNEILDDLYDQLTTDIASNRGWTPEFVKQLIDEGPYTAKQALKSDIVDELLYEDQIMEIAKDLAETDVRLMNIHEYLNSGLSPQEWLVPQPRIAVIEAEGMMVTGESFTDPFTGISVMGANTIARAIQQTREDKSIHAVVLRINSGGGLVIAADIIWHDLVRLAQEKPLVVSMGDIAASGGYYIAAPADVIVAEPGTITGSIGVIGGKYSFKGLYEKIGIKKEIIKRGAHADFYSDYSDYPPEEKEIVQKQINEIYDDFITKVAFGRDQLTKVEVDKVARGRVWTGKQAKEKGLVDKLGGLSTALLIAKERAGLERKVTEIVRLPKSSWLTQFLRNMGHISSNRRTIISNIFSTGGQSSELNLINKLKSHRVFLLAPFELNLGLGLSYGL